MKLGAFVRIATVVFALAAVVWLISGVLLDMRFERALTSQETYIASAGLVKVNAIAWRFALATFGSVLIARKAASVQAG